YNGIEGISRFLNRVWSLVVDAGAPASGVAGPTTGSEAADARPGAADAGVTERELARAVNHAIKEITDDLEGFRFNTAIA
ncbi:MAG TPA: hypothetical protein VFN03_02820, partial [Trueperaceae bacterium]|nr:hypothetical protein [Trueperaceae bacterium]